MSGFLSMTNLGRIAKVIALLLFVLPWVTVSCADQTLVSMTGVDLATGHISMAANPMVGPSAAAPAEHGGDLLVIIGAVLILAGLAVSFILKGSRGAMAAGACAALAAVSLAYTVLVRIPGAARADATSSAGGGAGSAGGPSPEQIAEMIRVNIQIGFYLCLAALIAAVVFDFMAMKGAAPAAAAAPPAEPPPTA
jgi:hypothetical protein